MRTDDLDYDLPPDLIAQTPAEPRDSARLLVYDRASGAIRHRHFRDLLDELRPDDLVVLNDTRVLPVRLRAHRATGGAVEVLLLEPAGDGRWQALARPMRRLRAGETLTAGALEITILQREGDGRVLVDVRVPGTVTAGVTVLAGIRARGRDAAAAVHPPGRRRIPSATRRSTPATLARRPRPPPGCTSRRRCSSGCGATTRWWR